MCEVKRAYEILAVKTGFENPEKLAADLYHEYQQMSEEQQNQVKAKGYMKRLLERVRAEQ